MATLNYNDQPSDEFREKKCNNQNINIISAQDAQTFDEDPHHHLHRGLKARQITMIAIGGAIGTGLIIGT
jgi:amino acid transporter